MWLSQLCAQSWSATWYPRPKRVLMRILTPYILRDVISHALIGAAIFTFVLFTRDLGRMGSS